MNKSAISRGLPRESMRVAPGSPDEFELWRWAVSPMFDLDAATPADRPDYRMESDGFYYAEMPISASRHSASRFDRSSRVIARAGLDHILVMVYEQGDCAFRADDAERIARAGDIVALDMTRRSQITTHDSACIALIVPRHLLAGLTANLDDTHGLLLPKGTPLNALLASHMRELVIQAPRLDVVAGQAVTTATAALVAACLGTAPDGRAPAEAGIRSAVLRLIRQEIDHNLGDRELGPELLAARFHLSRARLYRLFEPLGGVMAYIQQRRLMRINQMITNPAFFHESITTIAERFGFTDKSVFSRAYRALYGVSPSDARAQAHAGLRTADLVQHSAADSFLQVNRWILGMQTGQP